MKIKVLKVIGVIVALVFYFLLGSLYEILPCFLTSIFSSIDNSVFENMKVLFGSVLFSGVVQKIVVILRKEKINNVCLSNFMGALASMPIFLILFLPVYLSMRNSFIMNSMVVVITIVLSEYVSYVVMHKNDVKYENKTILMAIGMYIFFTILTHV